MSTTICGKCGKEFDGLMAYLPKHDPCIKDKRHYYKTAKLRSISKAYVSTLQWDELTNMYLCELPFGRREWVPADDLEAFCL